MLYKNNLLVIKMDVGYLTQLGNKFRGERFCERGGIGKNCGNLSKRQKAKEGAIRMRFSPDLVSVGRCDCSGLLDRMRSGARPHLGRLSRSAHESTEAVLRRGRAGARNPS